MEQVSYRAQQPVLLLPAVPPGAQLDVRYRRHLVSVHKLGGDVTRRQR